MIVAVTGHRPSKIDGDYTLSSPKWKAIRAWFDLQIAEHQPTKLISGMALGVDQVAAQAALDAGITLARNEWMVDNSDELWAVTDGTSGGTKACIEYAVRAPVVDLFSASTAPEPGYLVRTYFPPVSPE